jgi:hypothetical protein
VRGWSFGQSRAGDLVGQGAPCGSMGVWEYGSMGVWEYGSIVAICFLCPKVAYLFALSRFFLPTPSYHQRADGNAEPHRFNHQLGRRTRHEHSLVTCCTIHHGRSAWYRVFSVRSQQKSEMRQPYWSRGGAYSIFLPTGSIPLVTCTYTSSKGRDTGSMA